VQCNSPVQTRLFLLTPFAETLDQPTKRSILPFYRPRQASAFASKTRTKEQGARHLLRIEERVYDPGTVEVDRRNTDTFRELSATKHSCRRYRLCIALLRVALIILRWHTYGTRLG
jgi:hypothetical protein